MRWVVQLLSALAVLASVSACSSTPADGRGSADDIEQVEPGSEVLEGKADSAAGNVELKFSISPEQIDLAFEIFELDPDKASERDVYFYDTPALALYAGGVILRARKFIGAADDSTVKLRPLEASDVPSSWFALEGFKCEEDRSVDDSKSSCSLSWRQDKGEIDAVADGSREIVKLYSAEQEQFLGENGSIQPSWASLEVLGPAEAWVWSVKSSRLDRKLTIEYWSLGGDEELLEISTRTTSSSADSVMEKVSDYLYDRGFDTSAGQDGKTKAALDYFSAH